MKHRNKLLIIIIFVLVIFSNTDARQIAPVTPGASPEAKALLVYLQGLKGKYTLSGQPNFPISKDRNTQFAASYIGETPALVIDSKITFTFGARPVEINETDSWQLKHKGRKLVIVQKVNSRMGERTSILVL